MQRCKTNKRKGWSDKGTIQDKEKRDGPDSHEFVQVRCHEEMFQPTDGRMSRVFHLLGSLLTKEVHKWSTAQVSSKRTLSLD